MTVRELIEQLFSMPLDANVIGESANPERRGTTGDVVSARLMKFVQKRRPFRDMMDSTDYDCEVYELDSNGAECVMLFIR